jgi:two-component system chemotaxis response regulator CheB
MTPTRDVIVIGGSAGSIEPLQLIARQLPEDLPAAVFVVIHLSPRARSSLPEILGTAGRLAAAHPADGELLQRGRIYVAPPDHHLVIERDHVHVSAGPKDNRQRPSINVTFRSASVAFGAGVVGVLLSGQLDDGTVGLWEIKRRGGIAVVQHPEDATFPSMPLSALRDVEVDYTVRSADMPRLLTRLVSEELPSKEQKISSGDDTMQSRVVDLTCPECKGTIWEIPYGNGGIKEFRCRVGHSYSPGSMFAEQYAAQEAALWSAIVSLEEGASLANKLAASSDTARDRERFVLEAQQRQEEADTIRTLLQGRRNAAE